MSTWNTITIENPGELTLDSLPDALTGSGEIWEGRDEDDERVTIPARVFPGYTTPEQPGDPKGTLRISGRSKWEADEAKSAVIDLTEQNPDMTITFYEEWDDDEVGRRETIYRNGGPVAEESRHSELVPDNLHELVAAVRKYVRRDHRGDIYTDMGAEPMKAVMALVDALDPKEKS